LLIAPNANVAATETRVAARVGRLKEADIAAVFLGHCVTEYLCKGANPSE